MKPVLNFATGSWYNKISKNFIYIFISSLSRFLQFLFMVQFLSLMTAWFHFYTCTLCFVVFQSLRFLNLRSGLIRLSEKAACFPWQLSWIHCSAIHIPSLLYLNLGFWKEYWPYWLASFIVSVGGCVAATKMKVFDPTSSILLMYVLSKSACIYVCMYVCMHACVHIWLFIYFSTEHSLCIF